MPEKKTRAPQTGMALEMDVMKKIEHQLSRLPEGSEAASRVVAYVAQLVSERRFAKLATNGQLNAKQPVLFE